MEGDFEAWRSTLLEATAHMPTSPFLNGTASRIIKRMSFDSTEPKQRRGSMDGNQRRVALLEFLSSSLKRDFRGSDLRNLLHDGVVCCRLLKTIYPGAPIDSKHLTYATASRTTNTRAFLKAFDHVCNEHNKLPDFGNLDETYSHVVAILDRLRILEFHSPHHSAMERHSMSSGSREQVQASKGQQSSSKSLRNLFPGDTGIIIRPDEDSLDSEAQSTLARRSISHISERPPTLKKIEINTISQTAGLVKRLSCPSNILYAQAPNKNKTRPRRALPVGSVSPSTRAPSPKIVPENLVTARESVTIDTGATYILGNVIGKGQFGVVHRAIDTSNGHIVAIKRIALQDRGADEIKLLMHEVELLKDLSSSSVVQYIGFLKDSQNLNIVVEYMENGSLLSTIRTFGCFNEKLCAAYTFKILEGILYLHTRNVIHCDLKCANVLTTKAGAVKLSDFGVSLNATGDATLKGEVNGTPNWLAPEVITLRGACKASDIWALGCTVLEMIQGRPPYGDQVTMAAMYSIVEDLHPPLPTRISDELRSFLLTCFHKDPKSRPRADELLQHPWIVVHSAMAKKQEYQPAVSESDESKDPRASLVSTFSEEQIRQINGDNLSRNGTKDIQSHIPDTIPSSAAVQQLENIPSHSELQAKQVKVLIPRMPAHKLARISFEYRTQCSICTQWMKKAVYCETCHVVAHPKCLGFDGSKAGSCRCSMVIGRPEVLKTIDIQKAGTHHKQDPQSILTEVSATKPSKSKLCTMRDIRRIHPRSRRPLNANCIMM